MNKPAGFGDAETKQILERAAEIDAQRPLDATALREIAAEAGISPASLEQALAEHHEVAAAVPAPMKRSLADRLRGKLPLVIIVLVLAFYVIVRTFETVRP